MLLGPSMVESWPDPNVKVWSVNRAICEQEFPASIHGTTTYTLDGFLHTD